MSNQDKLPGKQIMIWLGSITTVLTLIFGLQRLYSQTTTTIEAKEEVGILIKISKIKVDVGDYTQAWELLTQAEEYEVMEEEIEVSKANTAMVWLRKMHSNNVIGKFSEQSVRILLVLTKAATRAEGEYLADIYAHLGWADFLRHREGSFNLKPEIYYEKALAVDADNVYANAMYGHWLSRHGRDPDKGWQHLQAAAKTGKNLAYTRDIQFGALSNLGYTNINFLKLLHEMRLNSETVDEKVVSHVLSTIYVGNGFRRFFDALSTGKPVKTSIAPEDDLALIVWLWQEHPKLVENYQRFRPYIDAILTEASGDKYGANVLYKELQAGLPDNNPFMYQIDEYMQNAVDRTGTGEEDI
jgi:hypothetical protein